MRHILMNLKQLITFIITFSCWNLHLQHANLGISSFLSQVGPNYKICMSGRVQKMQSWYEDVSKLMKLQGKIWPWILLCHFWISITRPLQFNLLPDLIVLYLEIVLGFITMDKELQRGTILWQWIWIKLWFKMWQ